MQASLDGFDAPSRPTDRLFFALFPDAAAAQQAGELAAALCRQHGLSGRPLPRERMHVTLAHLGDFVGLPAGLVRDACQAAASLDERPFDVQLARAGSFVGRTSRLPLVALGDDGVQALKAFHGRLDQALRRQGVRRVGGDNFVPHLTLLYDDKRVPQQAIAPLHWRAVDFALVHSHLGQTRYDILGRWPLRQE